MKEDLKCRNSLTEVIRVHAISLAMLEAERVTKASYSRYVYLVSVSRYFEQSQSHVYLALSIGVNPIKIASSLWLETTMASWSDVCVICLYQFFI